MVLLIKENYGISIFRAILLIIIISSAAACSSETVSNPVAQATAVTTASPEAAYIPTAIKPTVTAPPSPTPIPTQLSITATPEPEADETVDEQSTLARSTGDGLYYVDTTGSDKKDRGSADAPWATISYALKNVPDGSTVIVRPGTYMGKVNLRGTFAQGVTVRSEVPYQARLRHHQTVVTGFRGQGITLEGFDIAHDGPGAGKYVIQIQDLRSQLPGADDPVSRITLRNNILHDSYNNDILKVNNGATDIIIEGNIFYNQSGSDSHIDANGVSDIIIQDNVFFNDFAESGRPNNNDTGSYIVIKDSLVGEDAYEGSQNITVRRNVLLNWEGLKSNTFIVIGEDSVDYYQAHDVLIENNLMLGNSGNPIRAAFGVKGSRDVTFRHNTVIGDLPGQAYTMRLNTQENNKNNKNIYFYNNIWADPTGTFGSNVDAAAGKFSDTEPTETESFILNNNLYWNGGEDIPYDETQLVNYTDDLNGLVGDPLLGDQSHVVLPHWLQDENRFADGSLTIAEVFKQLVTLYGTPAAGSVVIDAANPDYAAPEDILGNPRPGDSPDIGAVEYQNQ
ncbi:MAG: hypothetical protein KDJ52_01960 [Anaerolineae bacterium]|nr:hypothetical protein [Anaerolineae bacterium]